GVQHKQGVSDSVAPQTDAAQPANGFTRSAHESRRRYARSGHATRTSAGLLAMAPALALAPSAFAAPGAHAASDTPANSPLIQYTARPNAAKPQRPVAALRATTPVVAAPRAGIVPPVLVKTKAAAKASVSAPQMSVVKVAATTAKDAPRATAKPVTAKAAVARRVPARPIMTVAAPPADVIDSGQRLTWLDLPQPVSRTAQMANEISRSIVVRRSTRVTQPRFQTTESGEILAWGPVQSTPKFSSSTPARFAGAGDSRLTVVAAASTSPALAQGASRVVVSRTALGQTAFDRAAVRVIRPTPVQWLASVAPVASLPAATEAPPTLALPDGLPTATLPANELASVSAMRKVIAVSALKLPPASQPLPKWMRSKAMPIDSTLAPSLPPASLNGKRVAQNTATGPLRQPQRPVTNSDRLPNQLEVAAGTFVVLVTTSDLNTVAVAEPNIADVAVVNSRAVLVNGKTPGVTSLVIVDNNRIRQYQVRVTPAQGTRPTDVAAAIGLPGVSVRPLRDALVLEGEVETAEEARRAVEIAGIFSTRVINQLT
ncbi:MAG TPA: pilus assembly protein N-terminal domain-containing protein, partial [Abditibacteriaceae bacterium]